MKTFIDWYESTRPPQRTVWNWVISVFLLSGIAILGGLATGSLGIAFLGVLFGTVSAIALYLPVTKYVDERDARLRAEAEHRNNVELLRLKRWHEEVDAGEDPDHKQFVGFVKAFQRHLDVPKTGEVDMPTINGTHSNCDYCAKAVEYLKDKK